MVSDAAAPVPGSLVVSLRQTLKALGSLHARTASLLHAGADVSTELAVLSVAELDRLRGVIRQGGAQIARRMENLVGIDDRTARIAGLRWERAEGSATFSRFRGRRQRVLRSLVVTYRAACRCICAALLEAKRACDAATMALLSGLLHRLEKQLWLLDSSPGRTRVGLPTVNLFLSC